MMSVSIIIPTYKPGEYMISCLDSLCHQTIEKEAFEVIIILNGPREPFFQQLNQYALCHKDIINIRILYSEIAGVSAARNMGIDEAQGEYIAFIDDDDMVSETYLAQMLASMDDNSVMVSNVLALDDETNETYEYFLTKEYQKLVTCKRPSFFTARRVLSPAWCKLIPKSLIAKDRFPTDFALGEDSLFMFTISKRIKEVRFAPSDAIYVIRHRTGSASRRHYDYWFRTKLAFRTTFRYLTIYMRSPLSYDFPFFLSRIAATLRKLIRKAYETE